MTAPFRLRRLLHLREQHEQALARDLATATQVANGARQSHDDLRRARQQSLENTAQVVGDGTTVGELVSLTRALREFDEHAVIAEERTIAAEARMHEANEALAVAARARMMLDRLRVRHQEAARLEVNATDRKTMDSIALSRFGHKRRQPVDNGPAQ